MISQTTFPRLRRHFSIPKILRTYFRQNMIVLDIGEGDRIVGIEILDASEHVTLDRLLPVRYEITKT